MRSRRLGTWAKFGRTACHACTDVRILPWLNILHGPRTFFLFARNKRNVLIDETLTWKFRVDAVFGDGDGVVVQLVL